MTGDVVLAGAVGLSGGEWSANWQVTKSTKCVYMIRRLRELGMAPPVAQRGTDAPSAPHLTHQGGSMLEKSNHPPYANPVGGDHH
eukprot:scaffold184232_cov17-Prasinocladus_malaysianus.AAC.1